MAHISYCFLSMTSDVAQDSFLFSRTHNRSSSFCEAGLFRGCSRVIVSVKFCQQTSLTTCNEARVRNELTASFGELCMTVATVCLRPSWLLQVSYQIIDWKCPAEKPG